MALISRGLAPKLPEDSRALLIGIGVKPLRYFANGPIKKDCVQFQSNLSMIWQLSLPGSKRAFG